MNQTKSGGVIMTDEQRQISERQKEYWKKNVAIIRNLLIIWAAVSFVPAIFFAEALHKIQFFGVPLAFWFAQQGSMVVFVGLIFYYAWRMDKLDQEYEVEEVKVTDKAKGKGVSV
jgi:putative solute:sodium symporter small subunit